MDANKLVGHSCPGNHTTDQFPVAIPRKATALGCCRSLCPPQPAYIERVLPGTINLLCLSMFVWILFSEKNKCQSPPWREQYSPEAQWFRVSDSPRERQESLGWRFLFRQSVWQRAYCNMTHGGEAPLSFYI